MSAQDPAKVWAETQVNHKLAELCHTLQWEFRPRPWHSLIHDNKPGDIRKPPIMAGPSSDKGPLAVTFLFTYHADDFSGPWILDAREGTFILRRNAALTDMHWCMSRHSGLSLVATKNLAALAADELRATVTALQTEFSDFLSQNPYALSRALELPAESKAKIIPVTCPHCEAKYRCRMREEKITLFCDSCQSKFDVFGGNGFFVAPITVVDVPPRPPLS